MSTITTLVGTDGITTANSMAKINANFSNLNTDKVETSVLDTDTALAANSDSKVATQKAVKTYIDTTGGANASTTVRGIVEEATTAEIAAGTAAGGTGARLFVNPSSTTATSTGASDVGKIPTLGSLGRLSGTILGGQAIYVSNDLVNISDQTETTLVSVSVAANTMGATGILRAFVYVQQIFNNIGTNTITFKVKFGATTMITYTYTPVDITRAFLEVILFNDNVTNAQQALLKIDGFVPDSATFRAHQVDMGTAAIDTTSAATFAITCTRSATQANSVQTIFHTVEKAS